MFTVDGIRKLHGWTHASLDLLLDHLATLHSDDYGRVLSNFGFPTLQKKVVHIFNCEGLWIQILQCQNYVDRNPMECPDVADARVLQQNVRQGTEAYLSSLSDQQLNANVELHFPDSDHAVRTPALILHHVLTHAFHHKGQIVAMCRELGHPAPDTDLNQFVLALDSFDHPL